MSKDPRDLHGIFRRLNDAVNGRSASARFYWTVSDVTWRENAFRHETAHTFTKFTVARSHSGQRCVARTALRSGSRRDVLRQGCGRSLPGRQRFIGNTTRVAKQITGDWKTP